MLKNVCRDYRFEISFIWWILAADNAQQFLQKRLFGIPFPREQRREAKEKYEERYTTIKSLWSMNKNLVFSLDVNVL